MKKLNLKSSIISVLLAMAFAGAEAAIPDGYYKSLEGKTGVELKKAVKAIVKAHHTRIPYGNGTWEAFRLTDVRVINGQKYWWDLYSDNLVQVGSSKPDNAVMNIEHSVAKSWWGGGTNDAYCDIAHLNPSNSNANSRKSNYPMAKIGNVTWDNGVTFIGTPASGYGGGATYVYEPVDRFKGDMARVFMYMFTVYDDLSWESDKSWMIDTSSPLTLQKWAYNMLLEWDAADPISEKEYLRNEGLYACDQKGRNPFIDLPGLGSYIWGSKSGQPFTVNPTGIPDPDPDPDPVDPTPDPDPDPDPDKPGVSGEYVPVTAQSQIGAGYQYILVGTATPVAMSVEYDTKYFKPTEELTITEDDVINTVPSNIAHLEFIPSGSRYAIKVTGLEGNTIGYLSSETAKTMVAAESADAAGTLAKVEYSDEGVTISFGDTPTSGAGSIFYNPSSPRFTTYTSTTQEKLKLYRKSEESTSGVKVLDGDDSDMVEVWGNNILAPAGSHIVDLQGRTVKGENLNKGVYIVVKPTFRRSVKVIIR